MIAPGFLGHESRPEFVVPRTQENGMPENENTDDPASGEGSGQPAPTMAVGWENPPSFNGTDELPKGEGEGEAEVAASGPFRFDAVAVRAAENVLLAQSRSAVADYEALRARTEAVAQGGGSWGPELPPPPVASYNWNVSPGASNGAPSMEEQEYLDKRLLAEIGDEFALHINPAMRDALNMVSNSLQLVGDYIAMVNASGQLYSRLDRAVRFPEPPARPVTG